MRIKINEFLFFRTVYYNLTKLRGKQMLTNKLVDLIPYFTALIKSWYCRDMVYYITNSAHIEILQQNVDNTVSKSTFSELLMVFRIFEIKDNFLKICIHILFP